MSKINIYVKKLLQTDVINKNGRLYPKEVFMKALEPYMEEVKNKRALGELGHPSSLDVTLTSPLYVTLTNVSHMINDIYIKYPKVSRKKKKEMKKQGLYTRDTIFTKYEILNTRNGKLAKQIVHELVPAPRGVGSVDENGVVGDDYRLISIDLVRKELKS
jgi:hypothetical protein